MDSSVMKRICMDVAAGIPPEASVLEYDDEMLALRAEIEADWKETLRQNPRAVMDLPNDPGDSFDE